MTGVNALLNTESPLDLRVKDRVSIVPTVGIASDTRGFVNNRFGVLSAASMDLPLDHIDGD